MKLVFEHVLIMKFLFEHIIILDTLFRPLVLYSLLMNKQSTFRHVIIKKEKENKRTKKKQIKLISHSTNIIVTYSAHIKQFI